MFEEQANLTLSRMQALWPGVITDHAGFVAVPVRMLKMQRQMGLSATDMIVAINLLGYRWTYGGAIFPRNSVIAKRMGISSRTVQRSIERMIKQGLIERIKDADGKRVLLMDKLAALLSRASRDDWN